MLHINGSQIGLASGILILWTLIMHIEYSLPNLTTRIFKIKFLSQYTILDNWGSFKMSISSFLWDYYSKMISQDTLRPLILYLYCITMSLKKYLCLFNKQKQKFCDSLENVLMPIGEITWWRPLGLEDHRNLSFQVLEAIVFSLLTFWHDWQRVKV